VLEEGRAGRADPSSNGTGDKREMLMEKELDKQALSLMMKHEYS